MTFYKQNLSGKSLNHSVAISLVVDVGGANFLLISDNLQTSSHTAENHSISLSCLSKGLIVVLQATLEEQANMFREIMVISRDIMEQQVELFPCCLQLIKIKFFTIWSSVCAQQTAWDAQKPALRSIFWILFWLQERIRCLAEKLNGENEQLQVRVNLIFSWVAL